MASELDDLIEAHRSAVRAFADALHRAIQHGALDEATEDLTFDAEAAALRELLRFPPDTIEQARDRAAYLLKTRFPDGLDEEGLAFLLSFTSNRRRSP